MIDNKTEKELDISIPSKELDHYIDEEADRVRKDLVLDGFRKGKVPKNVIKSRYRDSLRAQAINTLVSKTFLQILDEKKWRPASQAELLNVEEGENIKFRLRFEVLPHFDVENYIGIELLEEKPLPDDYLLQQALNDIREQNAITKEVTRPAVVDDFLTIDLKTTENNGIKNQEHNITVRIGDRSLPDEMNRALVGAKVADTIEVKTDKQNHEIMVKKIEEKILPQIDNDYAKKENCKDVEELKKKLTENMKKMEKKRIEGELKESLSNIILERTKFDVPKSFIQAEYQKMLQQANLPDSDANKERFRDIAEKRARLNLILDKIAENENITVKEEEITNLISVMGIRQNDEKRNNVIDYVRSILNREKTLDFLFKNAKISKKSRIISPSTVKNASPPLPGLTPSSDHRRMQGLGNKGAGFTKGGSQ